MVFRLTGKTSLQLDGSIMRRLKSMHLRQVGGLNPIIALIMGASSFSGNARMH